MQIKVRNGKLYFLGKICSNFFFKTLFLIIFLFEAANTCFLLIPIIFAAVLRKIKKKLKNLRRRQDDGHVVKMAISKIWCRLGGLGQRMRPFRESLSRPQIMLVVGIIYSQIYLPKMIHKPSVERNYK